MICRTAPCRDKVRPRYRHGKAPIYRCGAGHRYLPLTRTVASVYVPGLYRDNL